MEFWWVIAAGALGLVIGVVLVALLTRTAVRGYARLQTEKESWLSEKATLQSETAHLKSQYEEWRTKAESETTKRDGLEEQVATLKVRLEEAQRRMEDWEKQREQSVKDAQAAVMKVGQDLSSKLLDDHKRAAEAERKQNEERVKQVSEKTFKHLEEVQKAFAVLQNQQQQNENKMQSVWQALAAPASVGQMAEVGLENLLKSMGLQQPRDFVMQYAMESHTEMGKQLRPDALLFLPQDVLMVVDAKASKFMLDMVAEEGSEDAEAGLKRTMQNHLKSLSGKDYRSAVEAAFSNHHSAKRPRQIWTVMYVPTDTMLGKIREVDPEFFTRAEKANIVVASPSSLYGVVALASLHINLQRQADNHEVILQQTGALLDAVAVAMGHLEKVSKQFATASKTLDSTISSVNSRLLPRTRQLQHLGVMHSKQADMPERLNSFEIRQTGDISLIEIDPTDVAPEGENKKLKAS